MGEGGTFQNTEGCRKTKMHACYLIVPGQGTMCRASVPCAGSMEDHPGWEEGAVILDWHRLGQTSVKG